MVEHQNLDAVFQALSDQTRRDMLRALSEGDRTVGELAAPYRMSLAGASKHLRTLERAGLVRRRVEGRSHICSLDAAALAQAERWLSHYRRYWSQRLDALEQALADRSDKGDVP